MRRLDPEPLAVGARGGVFTPPQRDRTHAGGRGHEELPHWPEKPIVCGAPATFTNTTWRRSSEIAPSSDVRSYQPAASPESLSVEATAFRSASSCFASRRALITCPPPNPFSTCYITSGIAPPTLRG